MTENPKTGAPVEPGDETVADLESSAEPTGGLRPNTERCMSQDSFPDVCEPHSPTEWCGR